MVNSGRTKIKLKCLLWDYAHPVGDDMWMARRLAEFFPFVLDELTLENKALLLQKLDRINLPEEKNAFIRMACGG